MLDRTENEAIGDDTLAMSKAELKVFKKALETFLDSDDFKVQVEAEYLLRLINNKLKAVV